MVEAGKSIEVDAEIVSVFTRWQAHCKKCGAISYVDTEPESGGEEILELGDIRCGLHPSESCVIELA